MPLIIEVLYLLYSTGAETKNIARNKSLNYVRRLLQCATFYNVYHNIKRHAERLSERDDENHISSRVSVELTLLY